MGSALSTDHKDGLVYDPFTMKSYCGYDLGEYINYWANFRTKLGYNLPKVFVVNWFREHDGQILWPGFAENSRVLKWIWERIEGTGKVHKTPIGFVPAPNSLDLMGLELPRTAIETLLRVDSKEWLQEIQSMRNFYKSLGPTLPQFILNALDSLENTFNNTNKKN
jgi:phosphoenolpyruvate carboxykinase (GTP)